MRDDDDPIRQFMPVLRRIIILVAVLTAIPVVMWTITAFVRTYVGPPKTPTFQHIAEVPPPSNAPDASTAAPSDNATTGSTQTSPPPMVEAKAAANDSDASAPAADPNAGTTPADGAANAAPQDTAPPSPASTDMTASPNPAPPDMSAPSASPAPAPMAPADAAAKDAVPADTAASETSPGTTDAAEVATASPPAYAAPSDTADGSMQVATQQPAPTNFPPSQPTAVDSLPLGQPIAGVVPLPRKRPATSVLAMGPVPMPMPRPDAAGASPPPAPKTPFDWLQHIFRAASEASTPPAAGNSNGSSDAAQ
jgi:hypothetical protein